LLSTVTFLIDAPGNVTGRELTVYDRVNYGFDLKVVPEPTSVILLLLPLFAAVVAIYRKQLQYTGRIRW
jgi:hypothetical protein